MENFQDTIARIPKTMATEMKKALAMLLKSRKPPPVTVAAQMSDKRVKTKRIMLITLRTILFFIK